MGGIGQAKCGVIRGNFTDPTNNHFGYRGKREIKCGNCIFRGGPWLEGGYRVGTALLLFRFCHHYDVPVVGISDFMVKQENFFVNICAHDTILVRPC